MNKIFKWLFLSNSDIDVYKTIFERTSNLDYENLIDVNKTWNLKDLPVLLYKTKNKIYQIKPTCIEIEIDQNFAKVLTTYCLRANAFAAKMVSDNTIYHEKKTGDASAIISSLVQKWSYQSNLSILDMAVDLLLDIALKHKFSDGNKRTALITTLFFLQLCGLYVIKPSDPEFWDNYIPKMICDHVDGLTEEQQKEDIKNTILANLSISHNWEIDKTFTNESMLISLNNYEKTISEDTVMMDALKRLIHK